MATRICTIQDCTKPARSPKAELCPMHYHRLYRHGDVTKTARAARVTASKGRRYTAKYDPSHPLANANGKVYRHRAALYDLIGPGSHACHWCGMTVRWDRTRGDADCLNVDHLNGLGDDNRPENLVPSCPACNTGRGSQARSRALRKAGWWSGHDTIARLSAGGRRAEIEPAQPA
jgi:hypothetical protein